MFLKNRIFMSLAVTLVLLSGNAQASTKNAKNCIYIESAKSIHTRLVNSKLAKKKQSKNFKIISKAAACGVVRASALLPSVSALRVVDAQSNQAVSTTVVTSSNITLAVPTNLQNNASVEVILNGTAPGGIKIIVGSINQREKGAPFTLYGNNGLDFNGGPLAAGIYKGEIRLCASSTDNVCSTKLFSGTITVKSTGAIVPPVKVTAPPTPTATPTATPTPLLPPEVSIATLNIQDNAGVVSGEAPLAVFVKGIMSSSDSANYQKCMDIKMPSNGLFVPVGDPDRAAWESQGDIRKACFDAIDAEILDASSKALHGRGTLMTANYSWDFGDSTNTSIFNTLDGWSAAHTYDQPGDYFVALSVIDTQGIRAVKRLRVHVVPSSRRPVYVSEFGNDANDGKTEKTPIKSFSMIKQLTYSKTGIDLLFKKGETFRMTPSDPAIVFNKDNIRVSSYGTNSAPPTILWTGGKAPIGGAMFTANHRSSNITIENLRFDTDLAGIFGNVDYHEKDGLPVAIASTGTRILLRNNFILNVCYFVSLTPVPACDNSVCVTARPTGILVTKNVAPLTTGIRGYFIWNGSGFEVNAFGNRAENSLREHILRSAGDFELLNAQFNEFRNTAVNNDPDFRKGVFNCQGGFLAYIAHNLIHEGPGIFGPLGGDRGYRGEMTRFGKFVSNKFDPIATNTFRTGKYGDQTAVMLGSGTAHITIANNMFDFGNTIGETSIDAAVGIEAAAPDYNRHPDDIVIAHNTFVSGKGALDKRLLTMWEGGTNVRVVNNLIVSESVVAGDFRTTPIYLASSENGLTASVSGISQMSGNVFPLPSMTSKGQTFDSAIHGINQIHDSFLTIAQWTAKFARAHGSNGVADIFKNIAVDKIDNTDIPQLAEKASIQSPAFEGISTDFFGTVRKNGLVSAGAYEFPGK